MKKQQTQTQTQTRTRTRKQVAAALEAIVARCCGLDVHKDSIQACVRLLDEQGHFHSEVRSFSTMTADILKLADWLAELRVTHVAMESTGVYWKPIWNLLEDRFQMLLVNAQHIKHVPGRKTDVLDCQWIAQLLQHGLLKASLVPPRPIRHARDLTRHRTQLMGERSRLANRVQKVLEDANIKLASVATDVLGVSGRAMLNAMVQGTSDPAQLARLAKGRLQNKEAALLEALRGGVNDHHRFMLKLLLEQLEGLEGLIAQLEQRIDQVMDKANFEESVRLLDQIPGVDRRTAQSILVETGGDMSRFPSADSLCAWAGMCPGNHESAGKRAKGTTCPANRWLRVTLTQCAWGASHTKDTYLAAQYKRLAGRRGRKRALIATGHSILAIAYAMLKHNRPYQDLGADWFDRQQPLRLAQHLVKRLKSLGYDVTLKPAA